MKPESKTYVKLLVDSMKRKEVLLRGILEDTREQSELLAKETLNYEAFEAIMEKKAKNIAEIDEIDQGFNVIFKRVETAMGQNRESFKEEILMMQKLISSVTECSVLIQALEKKNSTAFQLYLSNEKSKIREKKTSSMTASNYYKSMTNQHTAPPAYFIDKSN